MDTAGILSSAYFLVGAILSGLGILIIAMTILALNYLFQKFWIPFKWHYYVPIEYQQEPVTTRQTGKK
jgi:hypothetical protein